jgi:hypothetical protein
MTSRVEEAGSVCATARGYDTAAPPEQDKGLVAHLARHVAAPKRRPPPRHLPTSR